MNPLRSTICLLRWTITLLAAFPSLTLSSMIFEEYYSRLRGTVDTALAGVIEQTEPRSLYEPVRYILDSGGKRVRAVLVVLAAEAVGGDLVGALNAGLAVELLHNFTLVHDDIMDRAATRRGRATVHTKWDESTALLVGDVLVGHAYATLLRTSVSETARVVRSFTQGMVDVCEGQALDREFEVRRDVSLDEYLHMIAMKTGRLLETAAELGGLVGGGTVEQVDALRTYARALGQAFQIQDDLLDLTADEAVFGKRIGGDIIEGKRTYLVIRALDAVPEANRALLDRLLDDGGLPAGEVDAVRALFAQHGVLESAARDVRLCMDHAIGALGTLPATPARSMLIHFAEMLLERDA